MTALVVRAVFEYLRYVVERNFFRDERFDRYGFVCKDIDCGLHVLDAVADSRNRYCFVYHVFKRAIEVSRAAVAAYNDEFSVLCRKV